MKRFLLTAAALTFMSTLAFAQSTGAEPPKEQESMDGAMKGMDHRTMKMTDGGMTAGYKPMFDMDLHVMDIKMMMPAKGDSASTAGYKSALMTMMHKMPLFTGNADADFMTQMKVHHQAAIDSAKVVLANGKDAVAKKLAQQIVTGQTKEIATIDAWLKKNGQ